ncbi:MAG: hypothetical protein ABJA62_09515 [Luteimonas sp.]
MNTDTQGALFKLAPVAEKTRRMLSAAAMGVLLASITGHASAEEGLVPIGVPQNYGFEAPCRRGEVMSGLVVDTDFVNILGIGPTCVQASNPSAKRRLDVPSWYGGEGWWGQVEELSCPATAPIMRSIGVHTETTTTFRINSIETLCGVDGMHPSLERVGGVYRGFGAVREVEHVGGGWQSCPAGQVAVGIRGTTNTIGYRVDQLGLICGLPTGYVPPIARPTVGNGGASNASKSAMDAAPFKQEVRNDSASVLAAAQALPNAPPANASPAPSIDVAQLDALAAKGEAIANQDPLTIELRNQQPDGPDRRGFDIGMAAAEGQTLPGPGKDRIRGALNPDERGGFNTAVAFSLERNRNADFAAVGAAIAATDPVVAAARTTEADVLYWLGFDIATGIFGDPALGARGNTATGAGSLKIRDALSAAGQRGFNAAVTLHLSRNYKP